ncbi:Aminopeptidase YwaD precursor [Novipirellula galeiformis]|uniref:Aminopeptidase YwaD n=1 Tax=Novipirellula galeiformis TaxID=2528004 RepID=A0A5C6CHN1_9BACT|nr:M28 family peptidase [Novipirellula galeiformis]TWU23074.1 Aminopeptidase YwaD precursor [Novipirellula galeiformis]
MRIIGVICLLLALAGASAAPLTAEQPAALRSRSSLQTQLRKDVEYLASETMLGRGVDNAAIHQAADYIAKRLAEAGVKTELFGGTPFQTLEVPVGARVGAAAKNFVRIHRAASEISGAPATDDGQSGEADSGDANSGAANSEEQANSAASNSFRIDESLSSGMSPMSIGKTAGAAQGALVFVGYGITAPELDYDDYDGIDVQGHVVAVLRKEPGMGDPASRFEGTKTSSHAFFQTKIENAIKHGAAAVILINDPGSIEASVATAEKRLASELSRREAVERQLEELPVEADKIRESLRNRIAGIDTIVQGLRSDVRQKRRGVLQIDEAGRALPVTQGGTAVSDLDEASAEDPPTIMKTVPVVSLARDAFDSVLQHATGRSLGEIETMIDRTYRPQSMMLADTVVELSVELQPSNASTSNVIGELAGRGVLAHETIVVGAHYDHVGMGGYGSLAPGTVAVHNGADDNASGTSAMLSTASMLVERLGGMESHRRVVFIGFTAEERGLLGSKYYVRHPRFALDSTVAMINLDMVGRLRDNELTVYGTGTGEGLEQIVDDLNRNYRFDLWKIPTGYGPSDHQSFYEVGIPVLFFFTGLHNDYHRPSDDSEKIDYGGLTRITDMVCDVAFELATREVRPRYAATEKHVQIRRQLTAFMGVTLQDQADHVVISGLASGGPAERSGLLAGDRLDRLDKKSVRTAVDVLDLLRDRSPGDSLSVFLTRDGQPFEFKLRLDVRPGG